MGGGFRFPVFGFSLILRCPLGVLWASFGRPRAEDFDFVVVGAGSAGCACAARLAKANFSVLRLGCDRQMS